MNIIKTLLVKIRYPKLILLVLSFYIGYLIYVDQNNFYFHDQFAQLRYFGTFLAGMMLSLGFTFAPGVAILLLAAKSQHIVMAWLAGSLGALLGSYFIFGMFRVSFEQEIKNISNNWLLKTLAETIENHLPDFVRKYILPFFAGIVVSTPLPDEFGVSIIAASRGMSFPIFSAVSFFFSTFGILIILLTGRYLF